MYLLSTSNFCTKNAFDHESSFTGNKITSKGLLALGVRDALNLDILLINEHQECQIAT